MTAPLGTFRPGDAGFGVHAPSLQLRPGAIICAAWTVALLVITILMLCAFVRLSMHQPRPPVLRSTIHPAWAPARSTERAFARLEVGEGRP